MRRTASDKFLELAEFLPEARLAEWAELAAGDPALADLRAAVLALGREYRKTGKRVTAEHVAQTRRRGLRRIDGGK